ncbi:hypothetical protein N9408_05220 [Opitutales bacterium]|nr:hypothetical protein [Opitutales bacterium]
MRLKETGTALGFVIVSRERNDRLGNPMHTKNATSNEIHLPWSSGSPRAYALAVTSVVKMRYTLGQRELQRKEATTSGGTPLPPFILLSSLFFPFV